MKGLSPKENREVPPLRYEVVERLKTERPDLDVVVNGGVTTAGQALAHLRWADGVMIGREAYQNPWSLRAFAEAAHGPQPALARADVVEAMAAYAARRQDVPLRAIARHMLGLFNGLPGARAWRRTLSEGMQDADAGPELLGLAMRAVRPDLRLAA